jgi:hypothetical protein
VRVAVTAAAVVVAVVVAAARPARCDSVPVITVSMPQRADQGPRRTLRAASGGASGASSAPDDKPGRFGVGANDRDVALMSL